MEQPGSELRGEPLENRSLGVTWGLHHSSDPSPDFANAVFYHPFKMWQAPSLICLEGICSHCKHWEVFPDSLLTLSTPAQLLLLPGSLWSGGSSSLRLPWMGDKRLVPEPRRELICKSYSALQNNCASAQPCPTS